MEAALTRGSAEPAASRAAWEDRALRAEGAWETRGSLPDRMNRRLREAALRWAAQLPPGARVLEVACGAGEFSRDLRSRRPDLVVVSADFALGMVRLSAGQAPPAGGGAGVVARAEALPFPGETFDAVFMLNVLTGLPPDKARGAVDEAARVSRGWMAANVTHPILLQVELGLKGLTDRFPGLRPLGRWGLPAFLAPCYRHEPGDLFRGLDETARVKTLSWCPPALVLRIFRIRREEGTLP